MSLLFYKFSSHISLADNDLLLFDFSIFTDALKYYISINLFITPTNKRICNNLPF